jgi:hypothetical protein
MQRGQQLNFPTASDPQISQSQADVAAVGDTVGIVFVEKGNEILFRFSIIGATGLNDQGTLFAEPGHTLQLPSLAFRNGIFHLVYVDATSRQVLYRKGILTGSSPSYQPTEIGASGISVFPNPVDYGGFWIKSETNELLEISLYDVFGKNIISQKPGKYEAVVPTDKFPKGVYFLKIKTVQREVLQKIVVN